MTTLIDDLINFQSLQTDELKITPENMSTALLDFSLDEETRINAMELYYEIKGDDIVDVFRRIVSIYSTAPTKTLETFLIKSCDNTRFPYDIRLESMLNLCCYREDSNNLFECLFRLTSEFEKKETVYTKRIETITTLFRNKEYHNLAKELMFNFLKIEEIDSEYRYKTVLSLKTIYDLRKTWATKEERIKLDEERIFFEKIFLNFLLNNEKYEPTFRILAAQFLLVNHSDLPDKDKILLTLLKIGENISFSYNTRADATDVVLRYGNDTLKKQAEELITTLGKEGKEGDIMNIYENAQNAHTKEIEDSALNTLRILNELPLQRMENGDVIDFQYVENILLSKLTEKAKITINRIKLDNALYGPQKLTLKSSLVYIYSFISTHEYKDLLVSRLCEELNESAGICSTGIMERMVNTFSGIVDDLSIRISFEDEILASLHGRLNKKITDIQNMPCIHTEDKKFCTCVKSSCAFGKMLISGETKVNLKRQKMEIPCENCVVCKQKEHLVEILKTRFLNREDIKCLHTCSKNCNNNIIDMILEEMIISTKFPEKRNTFLCFFRKVFPDIMDELKKEYETYIDYTSFDVYMKKAIIKYEGEN